MNSPQISVIIPVYNAEKYIVECLRSIQRQQIRNIEIICVDDGSTDNSAEIIEGMADQDHRIRLIRQANQSAGAARNHGMQYARGTYVHFADADDALCPGIYQTAVEHLERTGADICAFQYMTLNEATGEEKQVPCFLNGRERMTSLDREPALLMYNTVAPWNKLYRRSLLERHGVRFDEITCANDRGFYFRTLAASASIYLSMDYGVFYRIKNTASLTGDGRYRHFDNLFAAWESSRQALCQESPEIRAMLLDCVMLDMFQVLRNAPPESREEVVQQLQQRFAAMDVSVIQSLPFPCSWLGLFEGIRNDGRYPAEARQMRWARIKHIIANLRIWGVRGCIVKRRYR